MIKSFDEYKDACLFLLHKMDNLYEGGEEFLLLQKQLDELAEAYPAFDKEFYEWMDDELVKSFVDCLMEDNTIYVNYPF